MPSRRERWLPLWSPSLFVPPNTPAVLDDAGSDTLTTLEFPSEISIAGSDAQATHEFPSEIPIAGSDTHTTLEFPSETSIAAIALNDGEGEDPLQSPDSHTLEIDHEPDQGQVYYPANEPEDQEKSLSELKSEQVVDFDDDFRPSMVRQVDVFDKGDSTTVRTIIRRVQSSASLLNCGLSRPSSPLPAISSTLSRLLSNPTSRPTSPVLQLTSRPSSPVRPSSPLMLNLNLNLSGMSLGCIPSLEVSCNANLDATINGMLERAAAPPLPAMEVVVTESTETQDEELWREPLQSYLYGPEFERSLRHRKVSTVERTFGYGIS